MEFSKMHGLGNDYVYINCLKKTIDDPKKLAQKISNRNFGVGSDGLILIKKSEVADFKMDMYNADGSQGKMCGNGIRCVGKYVFDKGLTNKNVITVETLSNIKTLHFDLDEENEKVKFVTVNMGMPSFKSKDIGLDTVKDTFIGEVLSINNIGYRATCVSIGNPHCVIYEENIDDKNLPLVGKDFEKSTFFTNGINVEFVEVINRKKVKMRVWERGSGETLACGTGACAVAIASIKNGFCDNEIEVVLKGGTLHIKYDESKNEIYMKGSANLVFDGKLREVME